MCSHQARAIENQSYVIASNRVGKDDDLWFCGNSAIIDPRGCNRGRITRSRRIDSTDCLTRACAVGSRRVNWLGHRRKDLHMVVGNLEARRSGRDACATSLNGSKNSLPDRTPRASPVRLRNNRRGSLLRIKLFVLRMTLEFTRGLIKQKDDVPLKVCLCPRGRGFH